MFIFYLVIPLLIFGISLVSSFFWVQDLYLTHHTWLVVFVPLSLSLLPSFFSVLLLSGLKRRKRPESRGSDESLTVLVPAHNESESLYITLRSIAESYYDKDKLVIRPILDHCTDDTEYWLNEFIKDYGGVINVEPTIISVNVKKRGKSYALNTGLRGVKTKLVATIDADTVALPSSLRLLANKLLESENNVAGAGNIQIRLNENSNLLEKMQAWEYRIGIFYTKMAQDRLGALSVAHGACAMYRTEYLVEYGWDESCIGEDIVLTYQLCDDETNRIVFEPRAIFRTSAVESLEGLYRQRKRWARGWWENIEVNNGLFTRRRWSTVFTYVTTMFPLVDIGFLFVLVPGILLFFITTQTNNVFSWVTLLVLPLSLYNFLVINHEYLKYDTDSDEFGHSRARVGLRYALLYLLIYSPINMVASLEALIEHYVLRSDKKW